MGRENINRKKIFCVFDEVKWFFYFLGDLTEEKKSRKKNGEIKPEAQKKAAPNFRGLVGIEFEAGTHNQTAKQNGSSKRINQVVLRIVEVQTEKKGGHTGVSSGVYAYFLTKTDEREQQKGNAYAPK